MNVLFVAAGGALGSVLRYLLQNLVGNIAGKDFPLGTLLINIIGSACMGALVGWLAQNTPENAHDIRLFCAIGLLGGFTTFSSFSLDAVTLYQQGRIQQAVIYVLVSVVCSIAGLLAGLQIFRH